MLCEFYVENLKLIYCGIAGIISVPTNSFAILTPNINAEIDFTTLLEHIKYRQDLCKLLKNCAKIHA